MKPFALLAVVCSCVVGCGSSKSAEPTPQTQQSQSAASQQTYPLKGTVVAVDKSGGRLTVDHEAIPGFMGAMTMAYPVKDKELLDAVHLGEQITANVVSRDGEYWLERIVVDKAGSK